MITYKCKPYLKFTLVIRLISLLRQSRRSPIQIISQLQHKERHHKNSKKCVKIRQEFSSQVFTLLRDVKM